MQFCSVRLTLQDMWLYSDVKSHTLYEIVAVGDDKTCSICKAVDGMIFPLILYREGITSVPFHQNCKCGVESYEPSPGAWEALVSKEPQLVTAQMMDAFGWHISENEVGKLNAMLYHYGITDMGSVRLFMATGAHESQKGTFMLELGSDAYFRSKSYSRNDRGAGFIQVTGRNQHLQFLKTMGDSFDGTDTATYIAENYPMEASRWWWSQSDSKTGTGLNMNDYAIKYGDSLGAFLITQYYVTESSLTMSNDLLIQICDGEIEWTDVGGTIFAGGERMTAPPNWEDRKAKYYEAIEIFK